MKHCVNFTNRLHQTRNPKFSQPTPAKQSLVKLALKSEWEARFEQNSFGFRPGRSAHEKTLFPHGALSEGGK
ncbi:MULTISPECIES: hypothetical protein [unclassified Nostoc]|uniref:hypothetical protein n=1 Tax=unclassified Nostoc TaxID=2593658 RepID=UPI002AD37BAA|nr:hypothetical protein [Nostoc sp. DedQUE03]MDZ7977209.1 hypothetical protein [Nostoc sp. DedQUE03]MDZ8042737.1 hypothetical protein [Nostoc sp. DedQUE02]